ncbi:DUF58 domain-containing protein [Pontibacillus yanchengensis]|nr:DUF58 domain-containing protein [Pontibacillus yanchengensis]
MSYWRKSQSQCIVKNNMKNYAGLIGKLLFVVVLFAILYSYAMFQGGFVSWFLFFAMLPFVVYMFGLTFYPLSSWEFERSFSKQILQTGDKVNIELTIHRKIPFPLYYCIVEEYLPPTFDRVGMKAGGYQYLANPTALTAEQKIKRVSFPWFKRKIRYQYAFDDVPRGEHHFHTIRVKTGDFFGFIRKQHYFTVPSSILVYPNQRAVGISKRMNSFEEGATPTSSPMKKDTTIVTGIREYTPGDRFSWIDWKNTAKKNSMMTKEFEPQKSSDVMLVLDASQVESSKSLAFEGSVELSASLIQAYKRMSSQLGFMILGEERKLFPFTKDVNQHNNMNHYLARVEANGQMSFPESLLLQHNSMPNNLVLMIVTNSLTPELKGTLTRLKQTHAHIVVFYIDASERVGPNEQQLVRELTISGIVVNVLTENEMSQNAFEVNT